MEQSCVQKETNVQVRVGGPWAFLGNCLDSLCVCHFPGPDGLPFLHL